MMKKIFLLTSLVLVLLTGCEEYIGGGKEWDVYPINIDIYVQDSEGNDLLSSSNANNILKDSIYVAYDGLEFPLGKDMSEEVMTRAYMAVLSGLKLLKYGNEHYLTFGEFDGAKDWDDTFEIYWGDNSKDVIRFQRDFEWAIDGSPKIKSEALYLNGKKVEDKMVIIR